MYLRQMQTEDLDTLLDMAMVEGWSSEMLEFELYTQLNPDGCFTCIEDNKVVGGVMTFTYPKSGWIGNLVVDRRYRLNCFGKALFRRALRQLSHLPTQFLCASPMAVGLYSGFELKKILTLDKKYWHEDRSRMLESFLAHRSYLCDKGVCLGYFECRWF